MNTRSRLAALVFAFVALFLNCTAGVPAATPAKTYQVSALERPGGRIIEPGATMLTVRSSLGEPARRLDRDHWIYRKFQPANWKIDGGNCTTLLFVFIDGRVAEMRLINDRAETVIAASLGPISSKVPHVAAK